MAYQHGKSAKAYDFRAIPLAVGALTAIKKDAVRVLRERCLETLRTMGAAVHAPEPLRAVPTAQSLDKTLLAAQKSVKGLNKAYAERCRIAVKAATLEHNKRYFKRLIGRLRHAASLIPEADRKPDADGVVRRYFHVPPEIQEALSEAELTHLQALASGDFAEVIGLFRSVVLAGKAAGLTAHQQAVVRDIHQRVHAQHSEPAFGGDDIIVSLPLQYQVLPSADRNIAQRIDQGLDALLLEDTTNTQYRFFADISHPTGRGERIRLPLAVDVRTLTPLLDAQGKKGFTANSLTLELGPHGEVGMRLVVAQPKRKPEPVDRFEYVLARDFGYKNTISLSLLELDRPLEAERVEQLRAFTKEQAETYLSSHLLRAEPKVRFRLRKSGEAFLARINELTDKIEAFTSRIDNAYNAIFAEKLDLSAELGLTAGADGQLALVQKDMAARGSALRKRISTFFERLGAVKSLKLERRKLYRKIAAIKKNWFGYLANLEVSFAKTWKAIHISEALTNEAIEKESPKYKGKTFNKMINHGARGQYTRRVNAKLAWNGVPSVALPSWYTSSTCCRHAVVNTGQRKGDVFACQRCLAEGRPPEHADEHAADTLAVYATLVHKHLVTPALP
jgi:hypothetical protein